MADEREQQIAAIVARGRAARPQGSRALWILAIVIGAVCAAAFVVILVADPGSPTSAPVRAREGRAGFSSGIAIGLGVGIAIGYALARRRRDQASSIPHSDRRSP